jgi:hypothetical protein
MMLTSIYTDAELSNIYNNDPVLKQLNENLKNIEENHPIERSYKNNNLFDVVETRGEKGDALYEEVMTKIDRRTRQINAELSQ